MNSGLQNPNADLDEALWQQLARLDQAEAAGDSLVGWKLGLTSGSNRDAFGVGVRPFGHILSSRLMRSGATLWWDQTVKQGVIESEVCFRIASDVTETVDAGSIRNHIEGIAPAFEINQVRIEHEADLAARVIDNLSNWGLVVGALRSVPEPWDQHALKVSLLHNADGVTTVNSAGHIDDHFESIATLANSLRRFDRTLRAGQYVITGGYGRAHDPQPGLWSGDFGVLGRAHLRIEREA